MSDDIYTINLYGAQVTPGILAQIATALETHGSVKITNAGMCTYGPGIAALMLGNSLRENYFSPATACISVLPSGEK